MRHIKHDTIVSMQKKRIVPSRGKNIFEDQQKAQHSVRSHANKYFIKRERELFSPIRFARSIKCVCVLDNGKKTSATCKQWVSQLNANKKNCAPNWCILSIRAKIQTNDWQIYERWGEFIPFLFYMIYFKFFFRFCRISDFCITSFHVLWRKKNILELLYGFSILYFILPHFFHCFVIPSHILPRNLLTFPNAFEK